MAEILIVQGPATTREYFAALLNSHGHQIMEAGDGVEALELLRTKKADLVLSDVLMWRMDGYDFVAELRAQFDLPPTVMFCVAPSYHKEATAAASEIGVQHVLSKSANPELILCTVSAALAGESHKLAMVPKVDLDRTVSVPPIDRIDPDATVFIVGYDREIRRLLTNIMISSELKVMAYPCAEEFLDGYADQPGCLLTDIKMQGMTGAQMLATLRSRQMQIPAILLTNQGELADAKLAMRLQVRDFLDMTVPRRTLLVRVYTALQEDTQHRDARAEAQLYRQRLSSLTDRELLLVKLLVEGKSSKQIARELEISIHTVGIHRNHIMRKTGAANVADLVRISLKARHL